MEIFIILYFTALVILILSFQHKTMQRFDRLENDLGELWKEFSHFVSIAKSAAEERSKEKTSAEERSTAARWAKPEIKSGEPPPAPLPPVIKPPQETEPFIPARPAPSASPEPIVSILRQPPRPIASPVVTSAHAGPNVPADPKIPAGSGMPPGTGISAGAGSGSGKQPDLEKFIGENLVSKIGIAILVLAIGFFVKYAIDNDWIGPKGRVGIGLLCGGILVGVAHYLRKNYSAFSSVLVGGGLAIFYFTIALAYHQYHLFGQGLSFLIMVIITAFAVILSLLYDRQELAIIALVGGFAAPFLVSDGTGNYQILFSYLLILNLGLLFIAYHKAWRLLNLLAFLFTSILFVVWLATLPDESSTNVYGGGFLFATAFYILFFAINIAHTVKEGKRFIASDFGILLANTCFYFSTGLYLISEMGFPKYRGLFSAAMGVFNLAGSYFLFRRKKVDSNILYLLIGITLTFVSLTAPIQLHGHTITLFWASESVLLYWLSRKSGILIIRFASFIVGGAMLFSLVMDWASVYGPKIYTAAVAPIALPIIFNKGLMTTLYAAICCYALFFLQKKETDNATGDPPDDSILRQASLITGNLLLFAGGALEIYHQFSFHYPGTDLYVLYLTLYGFALAYLIAFAAGRWHWFGNNIYGDLLLVACLVIYLVLIQNVYEIQNTMLESGRYLEHFTAHWVASLLIALMLYRLIARMRTGKIKAGLSAAMVSWVLSIFILIFLSVETNLIVDSLFYSKTYPMDKINDVYVKTGLPILWGLCSFAFMWVGMRHKFKPLRVLSLVLFSVTLLKLFLFDIRNIPIAGKIAAFFCLGVLLLVVSFMYQRLKKIIIEDEEKKIT
jgi:uncharacterized membrane protein